MLFRNFPMLPPKLRPMIWQQACEAPQIHILHRAYASRIYICSIVNACKEARAVASSLQLHYFIITSDSDSNENASEIHGTITSFINLVVDTFWLPQIDDGYLYPPAQCRWQCGKCAWSGRSCNGGTDHHINPLSRTPSLIYQLAVSIESWRMGMAEHPLWTLECLVSFGVQELLLVVGESQPVDNERSISLVTPSKAPHLTLHAMEEDQASKTNSYTYTWAHMAEGILKSVEDLKETQLANKRKYEDPFGSPPLVGMNLENLVALWDLLEDWHIPKIRFVEAIKAPSQWVLAPPAISED